jgi:hypothetical protein
MDYDAVHMKSGDYTKMRRNYTFFYQQIYVQNRSTIEIRFLEKMSALAQNEYEFDDIRARAAPVCTRKTGNVVFESNNAGAG